MEANMSEQIPYIPQGADSPRDVGFRMFRSLCLLLCFVFPLLSGCGEEEKSLGTLTLSVSGNYADDFTGGGWVTAKVTAELVDAEGKSIPLTDKRLYWSVYGCHVDEQRVPAWSRTKWKQISRRAFNGLNWGQTPFYQQDFHLAAPIGHEPDGAEAYLTDIVGSRTVTVEALLRVDKPRGKWEDIRGSVTFTFGDGPLSLFSAPLRRVSSWAEAERACSELPDSVLPPESLLQLVSDNGRDRYGAAIAAGWPGDYTSHALYNYWTGERGENGKEARVVNVKDGYSLWYFSEASGPLAVCARKDSVPVPASAPAPPPDRTALRAEAEEMLLPHRPNNFIPVPDIWNQFCGALTPDEIEVPSYYGTPLPAPGLDGCYSESRLFKEASVFSLEEAARFDPSSIQNPILLDPSFALFPGMSFRFNNMQWETVEVPISALVRKAREGNPLAALRMSKYFPTVTTTSSFSNRSHFFWRRMADTLTRPGWADKVEYEVDENIRGLLGWPLDMLALGGDFLGRIPEGREPFITWERECTLRGRAFLWSVWGRIYAFNTVDAARPEGLFDKPDVTKGYAMALAGSRMPKNMWDNEVYTQRCASLALFLESRAPENGLDVEHGRALADELYAVYQENLQRILAEQRRHRAEVLPEVNRQIDEWLKELEVTRPKWLKQRWPKYPAYGGKHE